MTGRRWSCCKPGAVLTWRKVLGNLQAVHCSGGSFSPPLCHGCFLYHLCVCTDVGVLLVVLAYQSFSQGGRDSENLKCTAGSGSCHAASAGGVLGSFASQHRWRIVSEIQRRRKSMCCSYCCVGRLRRVCADPAF